MAKCNALKECACPKSSCPNHRKCCQCIIKHKETDSLPFCLFPENQGDKSNANYYRFLRKRFDCDGEQGVTPEEEPWIIM